MPTTNPNQLLARLKPHNPRRQHYRKTYTIPGHMFRVENGWYEVDSDTAAYLKTVHQIDNDVSTPLAFDVCTAQEAQDVEDKERRALLQRATADSPIRRHVPDAGQVRAAQNSGDLSLRDVRYGSEDNTDRLPGDARDLDLDDMSPPPAPVRAAPAVPGAPKSFSRGRVQRASTGSPKAPSAAPPPARVPVEKAPEDDADEDGAHEDDAGDAHDEE